MPIYKIRRGTSFSHGVITSSRWNGKTEYNVKWSKRGKEWTTEKAVKDHLIKAVSVGISMADWEILELVYNPTKPIEEWVDAKMLMTILKK